MYLTNSFHYFNKFKDRITYYPHPHHRRGMLYLPSERMGQGRFDGDTCVHVSPKACIDLTGDVYLSEWCVLTHGTQIITHTHPTTGTTPLIHKEEQDCNSIKHLSKMLMPDVWIYNSIILPACTSIEQGVIIGAGSVVTKSIDEPYSIWAGNPATKIGTRVSKDNYKLNGPTSFVPTITD